jgi:hypothetical protein
MQWPIRVKWTSGTRFVLKVSRTSVPHPLRRKARCILLRERSTTPDHFSRPAQQKDS